MRHVIIHSSTIFGSKFSRTSLLSAALCVNEGAAATGLMGQLAQFENDISSIWRKEEIWFLIDYCDCSRLFLQDLAPALIDMSHGNICGISCFKCHPWLCLHATRFRKSHFWPDVAHRKLSTIFTEPALATAMMGGTIIRDPQLSKKKRGEITQLE